MVGGQAVHLHGRTAEAGWRCRRPPGLRPTMRLAVRAKTARAGHRSAPRGPGRPRSDEARVPRPATTQLSSQGDSAHETDRAAEKATAEPEPRRRVLGRVVGHHGISLADPSGECAAKRGGVTHIPETSHNAYYVKYVL